MEIAEIIGLCASILVLVSFIMKRIHVIRMISIVGCVFFVVYGLLINALSIWLLNGILIFIHIFYLSRGLKKNKSGRLSTLNKKAFKKNSFRKRSWFYETDIE